MTTTSLNTATPSGTSTNNGSKRSAAKPKKVTALTSVSMALHPDPHVAVAMSALTAIRSELAGRFIERRREIDILCISALARMHSVLLGDPGEGKSSLVDSFVARIDGATIFKTLLTRFSTPEELFGPVSIQGLEQDVLRRLVEGYLPTARFGFLDEVFKANSSILNAVLGLMNEREFRNGTQMLQAPLEFLIGASNEMPQGEDLGALWDRFTLRILVKALSEVGHRQFMDDERVRRTSAALGVDVSGRSGTTLTLDQLVLLQKVVLQVSLPDDVLDSWYRIREALAKAGYAVPSTRRSGWLLSVIAAYAVLQGRTVAMPGDLSILAHVLWQHPKEERAVASLVMMESNPLLAQAQDLFDKLVDAAEECFKFHRDNPAATPVEKTQKVLEAQSAISALGKQLKLLETQASGSGRDTRDILALIADAKSRDEQVAKLAGGSNW